MQDWFLRNSETNRSCLKGWCMPVVLKSAHQFTRQISKQQSSNNQVEVFHPLTKQLRVFHVSSEPQMCPHWLVSLYVYRSGNDTHCSAKGPCSRHTCTHTHTLTLRLYVWLQALAIKHRQTGMYMHKNTHSQPCTYIHKHIYWVRSHAGTLPLLQTHTHKLAHTHTLSEEARWSHSVGCWPFTLWRLDFSLFLLLHRPLFLSSLIPLTLFLLHALIYVNTLHLVFSFILFSDFSPLHFNKQ